MELSFELVVDRETAKDGIRAIFQAILFHRLFGVVKPTVVECLGVNIPAVRDAETEQLIEDKVNTFIRALNGVQQGAKEGQLEISFVEKKPKKSAWFYQGGEEEIPWETWYINVKLEQPLNTAEREYLHEQLSDAISRAVMYMLEYTASERGRTSVPLISSADGISPFPIRTILRVRGHEIT